ncbi:hypothetical protein [Spiroplasma turonicum]|uniref:DUF177 domain-containing protein n=1 Tax=Spiroplasma turonicum TaxID=216946 RepID=A0A0K1P6H8_9MOLU|nr:hypothetical protein [Spiroplasma turonicum]AKU79477.1 hypothetical protein STURON_00231 [Spiroplasma turonicum]ALX70498.1 hypothetical protein STURO_v1c02300 [Spiroplasma turonicum]
MLKKDFYNKGTIKLNEFYEEVLISNNDLIKKILNIKVVGNAYFDTTSNILNIEAKIISDILAIDSRDGNEILIKNNEVDWNDEYCFDIKNSDQYNVVLGDSFDFKEYAIEQIVLNIPINLTNNYGKISYVGNNCVLLSEEEYEDELENKTDDRWDKLKDFKF